MIKEIILHCSATKEGVDVKTETIKSWHVNGNGWKDIGYNKVIELDGSVHDGRKIGTTGAHCIGHNTNSIGICYVGGLDKNGNPKDTRTAEQRFALFKLVDELCKTYNIPDEQIYGHYQFANKSCPCFDIVQFRKELKSFRITYPLNQSK